MRQREPKCALCRQTHCKQWPESRAINPGAAKSRTNVAYATADLSATGVSFAIIEALRPWSSAVSQREDVEDRRRRSNKVQVKDLTPYSPTWRLRKAITHFDCNHIALI
jgi:hypothetical protein